MADKYGALAEHIISKVGGASNIAALTHCLTRLRLKLTADSNADIEELEGTEEIIAVRKSGDWHQIVIGTEVSQVYQAVCRCMGAETDRSAANDVPKKRAGYLEDQGCIYRIYAPCEGGLVQLNQIEDATFASGVLGTGIAINPCQGKIYAPCDGRITTFFPTGHAIGITSPEGAEILIHVGKDTVHLSGCGFHPKARKNDMVKQGELLLEFDLEQIKQAGYSVVTPVIVTNTEAYIDTLTTENGHIKTGDMIITLLT